jgi:hypothetical protein
MREPIHLSMSSVHPSLHQLLGVYEETGGTLPRGKIWEAIQGVWRVDATATRVHLSLGPARIQIQKQTFYIA